MDEETTQVLEQAEQHRVNGEYDQAQPLYEGIVQATPDVAEAWWGLAHVLMNTGDFDAALECFQKACDLQPDNQRFVYDYAMMLTMLSMFDEARDLFNRCISLNPESRVAMEARKQLNYL